MFHSVTKAFKVGTPFLTLPGIYSSEKNMSMKSIPYIVKLGCEEVYIFLIFDPTRIMGTCSNRLNGSNAAVAIANLVEIRTHVLITAKNDEDPIKIKGD